MFPHLLVFASDCISYEVQLFKLLGDDSFLFLQLGVLLAQHLDEGQQVLREDLDALRAAAD